jgi:hypothetical protein
MLTTHKCRNKRSTLASRYLLAGSNECRIGVVSITKVFIFLSLAGEGKLLAARKMRKNHANAEINDLVFLERQVVVKMLRMHQRIIMYTTRMLDRIFVSSSS